MLNFLVTPDWILDNGLDAIILPRDVMPVDADNSEQAHDETDTHVCDHDHDCDCEHNHNNDDGHDHDGHDGHDHVNNPTPEFSADPDAADIVDVAFSIDPSAPDSGLVGTDASGLPIWSAYQTAQHIARASTDWFSDGNNVVTYSFSDAATLGADYVFDDVNQDHTRDILAQYAETGGMTFLEVAAGEDADITFQYRDGANGGGYWDGSNVVVSRVSWEPEMDFGTYNRRLMLHEIGHALGLSHPGPYNGDGFSYADADHWNDSYQYTNLSYWNEANTGASFGNMSTLGLHDILATQIDYGTNWSTRAGDSVYGFNVNTGNAYDLSHRSDMAFSIWDGGGHDTLDFSGSTSATEIDLRAGAFSSVNGQIMNISIAYKVVIEEAIGSSFGDVILGNGVGNRLNGGDGNDTITGGSLSAPAPVDTSRDFTGISLNDAPLVRDQYLEITDFWGLSQGDFTFEMMVNITRMPSSLLALASYAVNGQSNEFLIEGKNAGTLNIVIKGESIATSILTGSLVDGQSHQLSISWEQDTGALNVYVDGVLRDSLTHQAGAEITAGGTLIFGQEQDNVGGAFSNRQVFSGTMGEIRIFDSALSSGDIAQNSFQSLDGSTAGLLHNWQVQNGDALTITDSADANPPVNLSSLIGTTFTATQTSQWGSLGAGRAIDGDLETANHTLNGADENLTVDFGQGLELSFVVITNNTTWGSRLDGSTVSVLNADGVVLYTSPPITGASSREVFSFALPDGTIGHSVVVENGDNFLHIAEVEVYGPAPEGVVVDPILVDTNLSIAASGGVINVQGDALAPVFDASDDDIIFGGEGDDIIYGGAGDDTLYGEGNVAMRAAPEVFNTLNLGSASAELNASGVTLGNSWSFETVVDLTNASSVGYHIDLPGIGIYRHNDGVLSLKFWGIPETETSWFYNIFSGLDTDGVNRLSLTFDADTGTLSAYANGALTRSHVYAEPGALAHAHSGNLNLQIDGASFGDVRLYDRAITATEVEAHALDVLEAPASVNGLTHYWTIDSAGQITAEVGATALTASNAPDHDRSQFYTQSFNDTLDGGIGNDSLYGGQGSDTIYGGAGTDTVFYEGSSTDYTIADIGGGVLTVTDMRGNGDVDSISGVEFISYADGTFVFEAPAAPADIVLTSGDEIYTATDANDTIFAMAGNDTVYGGKGNDALHGGDGNDFLRGDAGDDVLDGGFGVDYLRGGAGADELRGGAGQDWADYITSSAAVTVNLGTNTGQGGDAQGDTYSLIERVYGSRFDDHITGDSGINYLRGWDGDDQLFGGAGNDYLQGGKGADALDGGDGRDWAYYVSSTEGVTVNLGDSSLNAGGTAVGDSYSSIENILGSRHVDTLTGDAGDNFIRGLDGDDILQGGDGADFLRGDVGADAMDGGDGADWAYYATSAAAVNVNLQTGVATGGEAAGDSFTSIERLFGSRFGDEITGDSGINYLRGYHGDDTLNGGDGTDYLQGDAGADVLNGGAGSDWAYYVSSSNGLTINLADSTLNTGEAAGDSYNSIENVFGSRFDDSLTGDAGDNYLRGHAGDDIINGGAGNDTLRGEAGADTFVFDIGTGQDSVIDYNDAEDLLDFSAFGISEVMDYAAQVGDDVVFTIGTDIITIENATLTELVDNLV